MAKENLVYLVADRIHIVHGDGTAIKHYLYEQPSEFTRAEHREIFGDIGLPVCTVAELAVALRSIRDAR